MTERSSSARLADAMTALPLVAILRGITPEEVVAVGAALVDEGFTLIEVPLNSPRAFESIALLRQSCPAHVVIGAGTVLRVDDVGRVRDAGGEIVVMPHADTRVIRAAKEADMSCMPGIATPTEAFAAIDAGADAIKLFPAELVNPSIVKALRAVLPRDLAMLPVGGIQPDNMSVFIQAGANGFGLGSALYRPGKSAMEVKQSARSFAQAWQQEKSGA